MRTRRLVIVGGHRQDLAYLPMMLENDILILEREPNLDEY